MCVNSEKALVSWTVPAGFRGPFRTCLWILLDSPLAKIAMDLNVSLTHHPCILHVSRRAPALAIHSVSATKHAFPARAHICPKTSSGLYGSSRYLTSSGVSSTFSAPARRPGGQRWPIITRARDRLTDEVLEVLQARRAHDRGGHACVTIHALASDPTRVG